MRDIDTEPWSRPVPVDGGTRRTGPEVSDAIGRLYVAYRRRIEAFRHNIELDSREAAAVVVLWCAPEGAPLGELGDAIGITANAVTDLVDRMEARGIVERAPDPTDRRKCLARLTPHFATYCDQAARKRAVLHEAYFASLPNGDQATITDFLETMTKFYADDF